MGKNSGNKYLIAIVVIVLLCIVNACFSSDDGGIGNLFNDNSLRIISSTENRDLDDMVKSFASKNGIDIEIDYAGTLEIMDKLNSNNKYDAVWISNSMWLYMLENSHVSNSKIISMNPVVFGIRKSRAKELGFVSKDKVLLEDIMRVVNEGKLKFAMTSATQTNTGASAYLSFLSILAGNPEVLTEVHLNDNNVKLKLKNLFNAVTRTSGSEDYLEEIYLKGNTDAIVSYESSIININQRIKNDDDTLYVIYPSDGVALSDSALAYLGEVNTDKEEKFLKIQSYLLSDSAQKILMEKGRRTWYGGVNDKVPSKVFNTKWGIDTNKYLTQVKYPSQDITRKALNMYQTELRKPVTTIFCLDYSGSMYGDGVSELRNAMRYILDSEKASHDFLQFSRDDRIGILFFNDMVSDITYSENGIDTGNLIELINKKEPSGATNIYDSVTKSINDLQSVDINKYNVSVVLMTDGQGNSGNESKMNKAIKANKIDVPVYSITFGSASEYQLKRIADSTGGMVFDGREDLLKAFKMVRGYN